MLAIKGGLDKTESTGIELAAYLHDIGKTGMPEPILKKHENLTLEEFEIMKAHTIKGAKILEKGNSLLLNMARTIALSHHEQWCGKGYPNGLSEENIPLLARIVSIADAFDSLIFERTHKESLNIYDIIAYYEKNKGVLFDPKLADIFVKDIDLFVRISEKYADGNIHLVHE